MSLLSLIFALLLEQLHPLASRGNLHAWIEGYADFFHRNLNAGERKHGQIAWFVAMLLPVLGSVVVYWMLAGQHAIFAWAFCVLVLYLTMGFRQFSHYFTKIHAALREDDVKRARSLLSQWRGESCEDLNREEIVRLTLEESLLATHRNVFAVVFWFVISMLLGLGPAGAILYRLSRFLSVRWSQPAENESANFARFAVHAYHWIEWLPLRLSAISFAIVGNFEDAIYCWRTQAQTWPDPEGGIVLASGAGALGVRLGMPVNTLDQSAVRPEMGIGDEADVDYMRSAIGLVWRALVFWLILLLLLTLAGMMRWVGV